MTNPRDRARRAHDAALARADDADWPRVLDPNWRYPANHADRTWTSRDIIEQGGEGTYLADAEAKTTPHPHPDDAAGRAAARRTARRAARTWHWPALLVVGLAATWALSSVALGDEPHAAGAASPSSAPSSCTEPQQLRALYVRGDQQPDRRGQVVPSFRRVTAQIDAMFERAGMRTGTSPIRFARDEHCVPIIQSVVVPQAAMVSATSITAALKGLGFTTPGHRYLYWYEGDGCGVAPGNTRPGAAGADPGAGYAALGRDCWSLQASTRELLRALDARALRVAS